MRTYKVTVTPFGDAAIEEKAFEQVFESYESASRYFVDMCDTYLDMAPEMSFEAIQRTEGGEDFLYSVILEFQTNPA